MYNYQKEDFLERLKTLRISKKLSQVDVSKKLGLSKNAYRSYEIGRTMMSIEIVIKFANELNIPLDFLLYGKNDVTHIENKLIDIKNNTLVETRLENGFLVTTIRTPLSEFLVK